MSLGLCVEYAGRSSKVIVKSPTWPQLDDAAGAELLAVAPEAEEPETDAGCVMVVTGTVATTVTVKGIMVTLGVVITVLISIGGPGSEAGVEVDVGCSEPPVMLELQTLCGIGDAPGGLVISTVVSNDV